MAFGRPQWPRITACASTVRLLKPSAASRSRSRAGIPPRFKVAPFFENLAAHHTKPDTCGRALSLRADVAHFSETSALSAFLPILSNECAQNGSKQTPVLRAAVHAVPLLSGRCGARRVQNGFILSLKTGAPSAIDKTPRSVKRYGPTSSTSPPPEATEDGPDKMVNSPRPTAICLQRAKQNERQMSFPHLRVSV